MVMLTKQGQSLRRVGANYSEGVWSGTGPVSDDAELRGGADEYISD